MMMFGEIISLEIIAGGEFIMEPVVTKEESVNLKSSDIINLNRERGVGVC